MDIKRILVPLPGSADHAGEIDTALSAAKALEAHVEGLFLNTTPPNPHRAVPFTRGAVVATSVNWWAEERDRLAQAARAQFEAACTARGIPILSPSDGPRALPAASWREVEGAYLSVAVQRAAAFDLIVAASGVVMESLKEIAEQGLLRKRRPVLPAATPPPA